MNDATQAASSPSSDSPVLLQPDNQNKKYESLFVEIDTGQIKLPMFQRDFVWDKEQSAKLIDSILKGFPIGTFIFWRDCVAEIATEAAVPVSSVCGTEET